MLQKLPLAFVQVKSSSKVVKSEHWLNEIRQIIYFLYRTK